MVPHICIPSSLCIHNLTILIFFVRSSPFCLLSDGSALLEKGFRFCMTTERAFAGRPNISFNVGMGFRQFQFHFQSFSIAIYLVYAGWSTRWSIQTNQQRRCCGRDNSKSTSLRWSPISRGSCIGGRTSCYRISSYWTPICLCCLTDGKLDFLTVERRRFADVFRNLGLVLFFCYFKWEVLWIDWRRNLQR